VLAETSPRRKASGKSQSARVNDRVRIVTRATNDAVVGLGPLNTNTGLVEKTKGVLHVIRPTPFEKTEGGPACGLPGVQITPAGPRGGRGVLLERGPGGKDLFLGGRVPVPCADGVVQGRVRTGLSLARYRGAGGRAH